MAGVDYKPTIFLFNDTQVLDESFLEDINNILSSGEVPNLYKPDEFEEVSVITTENTFKHKLSLRQSQGSVRSILSFYVPGLFFLACDFCKGLFVLLYEGSFVLT